LTGLSDRCRSVARDGARGLAGCGEEPDKSLEWRAVGEIAENKDPSNNVVGYMRRTVDRRVTGRAVAVAMVVSIGRDSVKEMKLCILKRHENSPAHSIMATEHVAIGKVEVG
jgi:hypothetical protein